MKAWRNTLLRFGLVAIPVSVAPARDSKPKAEAHTYDCETRERVKQAWQRSDGTLATETFKGYDPNGTGCPLEIDKPELDGDAGIDLQGFVSLGDVDPVLYDDCYTLWAGEGGDSGLGLVATILRDSAALLVAQARFTDRPRSVVLRWSQVMQSVVLHTLVFTDTLRATEAQAANADLPAPDAALLAQGTMLTEALPASWQPMTSDPLQAAILAQLAALNPAADSDPAAGDIDAAGTDLMAALTATYDALQAEADPKPKPKRSATPKVKAGAKPR